MISNCQSDTIQLNNTKKSKAKRDGYLGIDHFDETPLSSADPCVLQSINAATMAMPIQNTSCTWIPVADERGGVTVGNCAIDPLDIGRVPLGTIGLRALRVGIVELDVVEAATVVSVVSVNV